MNEWRKEWKSKNRWKSQLHTDVTMYEWEKKSGKKLHSWKFAINELRVRKTSIASMFIHTFLYSLFATSKISHHFCFFGCCCCFFFAWRKSTFEMEHLESMKYAKKLLCVTFFFYLSAPVREFLYIRIPTSIEWGEESAKNVEKYDDAGNFHHITASYFILSLSFSLFRWIHLNQFIFPFNAMEIVFSYHFFSFPLTFIWPLVDDTIVTY